MAGVGIGPDRYAYHMFFGVASQMTRSITFTVSCTTQQRSAKRQLWTLVRYRELHSRFTTSLGTWTDTVIPERLWADTHDV